MSMDFDKLRALPSTTQEEFDRIREGILALAPGEGESWDWFGLSYASWLVLPRVALQSMSLEWQAKFFAMVRELEETVEYPEGYTGEFAVTMKKDNKFVKNCLPPYRHHMLPIKQPGQAPPQGGKQ